VRKKTFKIISIIALCSVSGYFIFAEAGEIRERFKKGVEYTNQEKYDKAILEFTQIITDDKDYASAYLALGIVYINKKMEKEAVVLLEKAIELNPDNKRAYFILARLHEKLEEDKKAVQLWEKYLTLKPRGRFAKIAKKHLKRLNEKIKAEIK